MTKRNVLGSLGFVLIPFYLSGAHADTPVQPCMTVDPTCKATTNIGASGKIEFYRNYDLEIDNSSITKLVIISHGYHRNFGTAFARMAIVYGDPTASTSTLIIAPHFQADVDKPAAGFLYWAENGWASGNDSLDPNHISSYDVVDSLISQIATNGHFPNLREVILTGLSAGGQLTDRFAAGSRTEELFPQIHFRYIIASPSSYLYLDDERWTPGSNYDFSRPENPACAYNSYRYGLDNRNRYMSQKSAEQIVSDFRARGIVLMVGDQDNATAAPSPPIPNDPKDGADLDVSCSGELEGATRFERAQVFKAYLDFMFPEKEHPLVIGPGIAHQLRLYSTPDAQKWLQ